jgi:hypothetical protein
MAQKRVKKKTPTTKPKEKKLEVSYIAELCNREYADAFMINYKESGIFAISFVTVNPNQPTEGSVSSVVFMEEKGVEKLIERLNESLSTLRKQRKKK